jgi:hypothetical protein
MGLILDSSNVITAERRGNTVERLIDELTTLAGDEDAALSSVGLTELVHGIYRAQTSEMRRRRELFIGELLRDFTVSLHGGYGSAGGKNRWRATEPRGHDPI